jgi:hypothetical protein
MTPYPAAIWSLWPELSILYKSFFLILLGVGLYTLAFDGIAVRKTHTTSVHPAPPQEAAVLRIRCRRIGDVLRSTFLFFGLIFFISLPNASIVFGDGNEFPIHMILRSFVTHFVYAANVLFVFWILNLAHSFAGRRIDKLELQRPDLA